MKRWAAALFKHEAGKRHLIVWHYDKYLRKDEWIPESIREEPTPKGRLIITRRRYWSSRKGNPGVSRVRQVLLHTGGLDDVHCEIREAVYQDASTPVRAMGSDFSRDYPTLTSTVGQSIASESHPTCEGRHNFGDTL